MNESLASSSAEGKGQFWGYKHLAHDLVKNTCNTYFTAVSLLERIQNPDTLRRVCDVIKAPKSFAGNATHHGNSLPESRDASVQAMIDECDRYERELFALMTSLKEFAALPLDTADVVSVTQWKVLLQERLVIIKAKATEYRLKLDEWFPG